MNQINPKDRSMICRMAGNIAGPLDELTCVERARFAVDTAVAIVELVDAMVPCGKCDECNAGVQCREVPG